MCRLLRRSRAGGTGSAGCRPRRMRAGRACGRYSGSPARCAAWSSWKGHTVRPIQHVARWLGDPAILHSFLPQQREGRKYGHSQPTSLVHRLAVPC